MNHHIHNRPYSKAYSDASVLYSIILPLIKVEFSAQATFYSAVHLKLETQVTAIHRHYIVLRLLISNQQERVITSYLCTCHLPFSTFTSIPSFGVHVILLLLLLHRISSDIESASRHLHADLAEHAVLVPSASGRELELGPELGPGRDRRGLACQHCFAQRILMLTLLLLLLLLQVILLLCLSPRHVRVAISSISLGLLQLLLSLLLLHLLELLGLELLLLKLLLLQLLLLLSLDSC